MTTLTNLTLGQRKALYVSLKDQNAPKTSAERMMLDQLTIEFRNVMDDQFAEEVNGMLILNGKAKLVNMDTFGDTYRNGWSKIKTDRDGNQYVTTAYLGKCYIL